jgi:hypothetical protein
VIGDERINARLGLASLHEHPLNMTERERRPPPHIRRARLAKRVQIVLAIAAAVFAIYRLAALLSGRSSPLH